MPNSGEVKVIITDTSGTIQATTPNGSGVKTGSGNPYKQTPNISAKNASVDIEGSSGKVSLGETAGVAYLVSTVKQAGSMALANVGRYKGSTQAQTSVNNALQGVGIGLALYQHPVAALTSIAFTTVQTIMDEEFRKKQEKMQLANLRARNGYTDTKSILTSRRH